MPDEIEQSISTPPATEPGTPSAPAPVAENEDELPKWARERLTKANGEAARYRTSLREAEERLSKAKSAEDFETAVKELKDENAKLARNALISDVARSAKLPDELAELLQGSTKEELEAHAAKLQKFVVPVKEPLGDPKGGLDPNDDEDFDPVKAAQAARARKY